MDSNEILALKGLPVTNNKPIHLSQNEILSLSVPVSLPRLEVVKSPLVRREDDHTAFLGMNTSRQSSFVEYDMLKAKNAFGFLSFLPISKNSIAQGQHSTVFKGEYSANEITIPCAVKRTNDYKDSQTLGIQESAILKRLSNPSIITLFDTKNEQELEDTEFEDKVRQAFLGESILPQDSRILLILEFCSNGTVWDWIQKHPDKMGLKLWTKWAGEISTGVEFVHSSGIIHHDLKPHNILVTELLDIRICDFGNAVVTSNTVPLKDGLGKGTPAYTAPEIYSPGFSYSFPIDIYSTGVVFYTMISQKEPFSQIHSPIQQILTIQRGFFYPESQPLVPGWKNPDPSDGEWQFGNGEKVPCKIVEMVIKLCSLDPLRRLTAKELCATMQNFDN